jgi:ABC-type multidrug transport system fused ATPase/permease subunit
MSGGDFVSGDGYIFMTVMGVEEAIKLVPVIIKAHASAIIILNTIKRVPAMNIIGGLHPEKVIGNISFENVTFRYPSRPKVTVLSDLTLNIEAGKSTALVGSSGCGKSTIIALVERWYDPESGSVKLDGVDLRDIDQQWLHRYVGIVSQEPTLFATTIRKNITYAADNINTSITRKMKQEGKTQDEIDLALIRTDNDAIEQAAKAANAHQFIMKLYKGYDTMVGERGASLSGGQKQRVAIARAVLQNPQILLLDEATSALDTKSESLVQDALNKLMHGRTSIVIAHRLSTIQDCDQIVVFKEGKVVEMGKHDELILKEGGVYYKLAQKQMKYNQKNRELTVALSESDTNSQASDELTSDVEETITNPTIETPLTEEPDDKKKKKKKAKKQKEKKDEELPDPHAPKVTVLSMIPLIGVDWIPFILMAISSVVAGAIPILFILMYSYIVNTFTPARNSDGGAIPFPPGYNIADRVSVYCSYLAIICAGAAISQFGANFFSSVTSERLRTTLKTKYFNALISQEMGLFDIKKTGKLLNQLSEDVQAVQEGLSQKASLFIQHVTTCIIGLVLAFTAAWRISLLMLGTGLGVVILAGLLTGPLASWLQKLISARSDSATATATEVIGSMRTVRSMGGEPRERKRLADDLSWISRIGIPNSIVLAFAVGFVNLGIWGDSALAFWFGGTMISKGELAAGQLMQTFINILLAVMGLGFAATQLPSMFKALGSSVRLLQVIKRKSVIPLSGGEKPERVIGNVTFENIVFEYPSRPGVTVLKDFSLTINQGTAVALVGESGSGKSTIVGLLERFYDPKEGRVLLDGVDLKEIDPIWLHKNIAIVSQEPVLFATTIQRNIAYAVGDENVTMDQIIEAAKTANCHDFITKLPDGYQTLIGERGVSLSGGQKQRIAIARAMLQNASILLLDEATSALDTEAEHIVQQAIEKLMVGRTSIVIAHRLSTVANSDKIIVMGAGQVLEMGTHDELLSMNGEYRKLAMKQMQFGGTK